MLVLALVLLAQVAPSDDADKDLTAEKVFAKEPSAAPDGWTNKLSIGATGSMTHSENVVGTVNGTTAQLGVIVEGGATLKHGLNSWENGIKLTESFTRTPVIPHFIKSADDFRLQSTYLHHLENLEWLGPYVRFLGVTSIFRGWNVPATDTEVIRIDKNGNVVYDQIKAAGQKYGLTKPFEPLLLRQSTGFFATPITGTPFTLRTRLGGALQEIIAQNGFALADDPKTAALEYKQLVNSTQGGVELDFETLGTVVENVTYSAKADFFYPIFETNDSQLTGSKLQTDIQAKLSVHLSKYLSLDYVLSAKRIPLIVDKWQVVNGLLLSAAVNVI